jgi:glucose 1-dehydrogenase
MSNQTMRAVGVFPGRREVHLVDHEIPRISGDREIKIRTLEVGVCGTDKEIVHFVYGAPPHGQDYLILGHESLGEVIEVGEDVAGLKPGDLVVPSVRRPCPHDHCAPCRSGLQDFCTTGDFTERGIKMRHGYMTEYYVEEEQFLTYVPPDLRDVAVLVEPLTIAEKAMAQVWKTQQRLPWIPHHTSEKGPGHGLRAVVLGAGPVGILGAMALMVLGFETYVYSRSPAPNPKAEVIEALGAKYISSKKASVEAMAEQVGNIDLVYEALGASKVAFDVLKVLGINGIFVFTGIPAPKHAVEIEADAVMRNLVLKNQAVIGTVNADKAAFENAIKDLQRFKQRWPTELASLITARHTLEEFNDVLFAERSGIKNIIQLD